MAADICIVDDNQDYLLTASELFKYHGYSVCTIHDPLIALDGIRTTRPKIIILDIMMPNIDGFSLLKEIKENPELSSIPVIVISGKVFLPEKKKALSLGASDFYTKPISGAALLERISNILGKH